MRNHVIGLECIPSQVKSPTRIWEQRYIWNAIIVTQHPTITTTTFSSSQRFSYFLPTVLYYKTKKCTQKYLPRHTCLHILHITTKMQKNTIHTRKVVVPVFIFIISRSTIIIIEFRRVLYYYVLSAVKVCVCIIIFFLFMCVSLVCIVYSIQGKEKKDSVMMSMPMTDSFSFER